MKKNKHVVLFNSFIHKLIGIIILLALCVILTIYLFSNIIFFDASHHLIFFLFTVLIILFSFALFFIHRIISPIHDLAVGVDEISKGNLDIELKVKSKDELGKLAKAFNQMTVELKKMIQSRDQLLMDVSHELRTPITRTKLALEIMPDSAGKESIIDDIREMEIMITELLETERLKNNKTNLNLEKTNVKNMLEGILKNFPFANDKVKMFPVSENIYIKVDESKIITVIKNIIENSIKYSEGSNKPVEINVIDKPETTVVQIEDFGIGIPSDKMKFLFEPFYRADSSRSKKTGGYGLGLHMAKKIMDAHQAKIKFTNKTDSDQSTGVIVELVFLKNK